MALCNLHYFSSALKKMTAVTLILPEGEDGCGPFPVFYLLHGRLDDHTAWVRRTNIERYAQGLAFIVVMPDGGRGFYTDAQEGFAYETAMLELIAYIDQTFHTDARREARVIGGLSMGGYGALKLALKYPDLFCSANSHSGALFAAHSPFDPENPATAEVMRIFGPHPQGGPDDLFALAEQIDRRVLPALRIDCGTDDGLLDGNRRFHAHLDALGIPHEYEEFPGGHTWDYWDRHVQEALAFHARVVGLSSAS
jgi:S-formylglutathione hydrolase FrmB